MSENKQTEERFAQFCAIQDSTREVFRKKNSDYADSFANYGVLGILVRLSDKIQRATNLVMQGSESGRVGESVRDTLMDAHVYAALGLLLYDNPEVKAPSAEDLVLREAERIRARREAENG